MPWQCEAKHHVKHGGQQFVRANVCGLRCKRSGKPNSAPQEKHARPWWVCGVAEMKSPTYGIKVETHYRTSNSFLCGCAAAQPYHDHLHRTKSLITGLISERYGQFLSHKLHGTKLRHSSRHMPSPRLSPGSLIGTARFAADITGASLSFYLGCFGYPCQRIGPRFTNIPLFTKLPPISPH